MSARMSLILKWGLIGAFANVSYSLVMFLLDVPYDSKIQYLAYVILIGAIFFGALEYRDKLKDGAASFGDIFKTSFFIGLVLGVIGSIWSVIYLNVINPDMIDEIMKQTRIQLEEQSLSEEQIEMALANTEKFMTPLFTAIMGLVGTIVFSLVISIITGAALKKEGSPNMEENLLEN